MTDRPQGKRLGGGIVSTLADTTPPQAPAGQGLVPVSDPAPTLPPPRDAAVTPHGPAVDQPRAEDLVQRRTEITREQINGMVPKVLQLRRRMRIYQLDHDVELRDQMALALDGWLRARGY